MPTSHSDSVKVRKVNEYKHLIVTLISISVSQAALCFGWSSFCLRERLKGKGFSHNAHAVRNSGQRSRQTMPYPFVSNFFTLPESSTSAIKLQRKRPVAHNFLAKLSKMYTTATCQFELNAQPRWHVECTVSLQPHRQGAYSLNASWN